MRMLFWIRLRRIALKKMARCFALIYLVALATLHLSIVPVVDGKDENQVDDRGQLGLQTKSEDEVTFPFYLNCNRWNKSDTAEYEILLYYHVDMVNNWEDIVRDQMLTLNKCGLGAASSRFTVTYTNGDENALQNVLGGYSFAAPAIYHSFDKCYRQGSTTRLKLDACAAVKKKSVIFHFNAMGSAEYHWDWWKHKSQYDEGKYSRALYWRKYNEYFTIQNPSFCINKIMHGSLTCGVNLQKNEGRWRYTDDFFTSSCDYERTLPVVEASSSSLNSTDASSEGICAADTVDNKEDGAALTAHAQLHKSKKDRNKQLIYPEEYDDAAWRFRLKCPQVALPSGSYKLVLAYHVGMINNWKEIVTDQLEAITKCGMAERLDTFILSYSNGEPDELLELVKTYGISITPQLVSVTGSPWECPANNATLAHCNARTQNDDEGPTIVFYLHNKGASRYSEYWRQSMDRKKSYAKTGVYWRKMIEFFHIERPSLCIEKILGGAQTCGPAIRGRHYSGNFWVASCDYISQLDPCGAKQTGYIESEHWLGRKMGGGNLDPNKYVQLFSPPKVDGGASDQLLYLYAHLMLPEEYADETYGKWVAEGRPPSAWESKVVVKSDGVAAKLDLKSLGKMKEVKMKDGRTMKFEVNVKK